jgi:hypothetical protein
MESAGAMHVRMQGNMQYDFHDVCHIQIIRRSIFEELYLPRTYQYLEELNDQIHEALATVIPNMLRLATENLIKRARLVLQMKGGHFEHLL